MALFHLLKVKCNASFGMGMFDLSISHSSTQFKCSLGHLYKHIGMAMVKHFKTVNKVLLWIRGVNLGHIGECKKTLCVNVFDFNRGGHIAHQLHTVLMLDVVSQTNGQLASKEGCYLEQDKEEFALTCFHEGLEGGG
eukprot:2312219-Ditylum_brightwellii.AAC.1